MTDDRTCSLTPHVMADHLGSRPGSTAGREAARHIAECPDCQAELAALEPVTARLRQWREQPPPVWNRRPQGSAPFWRNRWLRWQWAPLAASVVLALAVVFNVRVGVNDAGWQVSFGATSAPPGAGLMDTEAPRQFTGAPVQRPDMEALRQSMALSLEAGDPLRPPGDLDESQSGQWRDDVAAFERALYDVLCRYGASVRVPEDESLTVLLSGLGESPGEEGRPGDRVHVVGGADLQACQSGDIDVQTLMAGSRTYSF